MLRSSAGPYFFGKRERARERGQSRLLRAGELSLEDADDVVLSVTVEGGQQKERGDGEPRRFHELSMGGASNSSPSSTLEEKQREVTNSLSGFLSPNSSLFCAMFFH